MKTPLPEALEERPTHILAVADWSIDPEAVADTLRAKSAATPTTFALLVPARLPGLDWIGDPYASRPCAERQLDALRRLGERDGLVVESTAVGDPERVAAIRASLDSWTPDRILLFDRERVVPQHPFSVARRVERKTGHAVERIAVRPAPAPGRRFRRAPRCALAAA